MNTIVFLALFCLAQTVTTQNDVHFSIVSGKRVVSVTKTSHGVSLIQCATSCIEAGDKCLLAGFKVGSGNCSLSRDALEATEDVTDRQWIILVPDRSKTCLQDYAPRHC